MKQKMTRRDILVAFLKKPENWVYLVTLVITVILAYLSLRTGDITDFLQAILVVLGLLAVNQLAVGYSSILRDHQIEELTNAINTLRQDRPSADMFFLTRKTIPGWEERLKGVKYVDVFGMSLTSLAITNQALLRDLKNSGAKIRLIVANPENATIQSLIARKTLEVETGEHHADLVRTAIKYVETFIGETTNSGSLQVRVTDYLPQFSYIGVDTPTVNGQISIEFYLSQVSLAHNPIFTLNATNDAHWYEEFKNQFEFFWKHAKEARTVKSVEQE